jgi:glycosyltransferase involved in cell wall biosynthesis
MSQDNILYIGPYREFSGMGNAARNYIMSLMHTGHNISIRPIYNEFDPYPESSINEDLLKLEKNSSIKYHKIIQHCYPHQLVYDSKFDQHIGILHIDTKEVDTSIVNYLSIVDNIVVGSSIAKKTLLNSGVKNNISVIPEPIDLDLINRYKENNEIEIIDNNFKFYTISSFTDKKNIETLLLAFLIFSNQYENADMIIKLRNIKHATDQKAFIDYEFEKLYGTMKCEIVKKPKILIGNISYDNIMYIHYNNDCYINTSHGESFGYSALEAMAFNNNIIVTKNNGTDDLLDDHCGLVVNSKYTYCQDKDRVFANYNSVLNQWNTPDIDDIVNKMFIACNEARSIKKQRIDAQNKKILNYTFDNIGSLFNTL